MKKKCDQVPDKLPHELTPEQEREALLEGFTRNRVKCLLCYEIIESLWGHDFKWCSCKSVAVDGGKEIFGRRRLGDREHWVNVRDDDTLEERE